MGGNRFAGPVFSAMVFRFEEEEMKKFTMAICVCLVVITLTGPAFAGELRDTLLPGAGEGLAAGALPPPGAYFINESILGPGYESYGNNGHTNLNVGVAKPATEVHPSLGVKPVLPVHGR